MTPNLGVCVGGPEDGKERAVCDRFFRVAEMLSPDILDLARPDIAMRVKEHRYDYDTVHWVDRNDQRQSIGVWWHESIDKDERFPTLLQRYADMSDMVYDRGVYGKIEDRLLSILNDFDRYSSFDQIYQLVKDIRGAKDNEAVRKQITRSLVQ